jgi:hypothetical protein
MAFDLKALFAEQLTFLKNSCASYDAGDTCEAKRIATTMRVLLHQTPQSTSLLTHLNRTRVPLFTTNNPRLVAEGINFGVGLGIMDMQGRYFPQLEEARRFGWRGLPANEWWNEVVYVLSPKCSLTRRRIALSATNEHGGAHVDKDQTLHAQYEALAADGALGGAYVQRHGEIELQPFINAHLVSLRQMGWELLNSPAFVALAT